jgi:signal transduction histidine kinase
MLKKLKHKLLFIHMSLLAIVLILVFGTIFIMMSRSYQQQSIRTMFEIVNTYSRSFDKPIGKGPSPRIPNHYALFFLEGDSSFIILEDTLDLSEENLTTLQSKFTLNSNENGTLKIEGVTYRYLKLLGTTGELIVLMDINYEASMLQRLALILVSVSLLSILVLFFISIYLVNKALVPVSLAWEKQRQFVADASHELKTPLTIIQTNTSLILSNENTSVKEQKKWLLYIQDETKRMSKLIHHLIYLAKVDAKEDILILETFDLSQVVEQTLLNFEAVLFEKNLKLATNLKENLFVEADKEKTKQVLAILLDNAIKNTPSGYEILIRLHKEGQKICYTIENTGVTLSKEQCDKVFERFYRGDASRSRESGSYGLGLSIGASIALAHQGDLTVKSTSNSVIFTLCLPIFQEAPKKKFGLYR